MLKKFLILTAIALTAACSAPRDEGKTPQTVNGRLNGCMLNKAYDLNAQGKLFHHDKWSVARDIMKGCERELHISSSEINERQAMNIIVSVIDSLH